MNYNKINISVVIPCYNEEKNIPLIVLKIQELISARKDIEVILVNNGSTDDSRKAFDAIVPTENIKVVSIERNIGYGHGILSGLERSKGSVLAWTHADMQTDPLDILTALYAFLQDSEPKIIKGRRQNRALSEVFFTFGMQLVAFIVLGLYLTDINAQPKLFSREFYSKYIKDKAPLDFSLDLFLLYTAKKNGYEIVEVPVHFKQRLNGVAKGGGSWKTRMKLISRTLSYIIKLRYFK